MTRESRSAAAVLDPAHIDELHYAAGSSASRRVLHVRADCPASDAETLHSCPASHPPRGRLCDRCAGNLSLAAIQGIATDGGQVKCCPECESADLSRRHTDGFAEEYLCTDCRHEFSQPQWRESRYGGNLSPIGRALIDADPDDLGDGDLVTDGGGDVTDE